MKALQTKLQDHPHHKSIWFAHGDVNGVDFWSEKGTIRHRAMERVGESSFTVTNDWMNGEQRICEDRTTVWFTAAGDIRLINYQVTITASDGELVFGDTKEGTFGIRTHPALRLVDKEGQAAGTAVNSEGTQGKAIWGQKAKWVLYQGMIDGDQYHVALMDHPDNLRHPTTWHAREYGLVAANPFGLRHFQNAEPGTGILTIAPGESLTLRYGILLHRGEFNPGRLDSLYLAWSIAEIDP